MNTLLQMRDDAAFHRSGKSSTEPESDRGLFLSTNFTVKGSNSNSFSSEIPFSKPTAARATQAAVTLVRLLVILGRRREGSRVSTPHEKEAIYQSDRG